VPKFEFTIWDGRARNPEVPFKRYTQEAPTLDQALAAVSHHYAKIAKRRMEERMAHPAYLPCKEPGYNFVEDFKIMLTSSVVNILLTDSQILEERRKRIIKP